MKDPSRFAAGPGVILAGISLLACFPDPALLDKEVIDSAGLTDMAVTETEGDAGDDADAGECRTAADCEHLRANCVKVLCLANTCATQPDPGATCDDGDTCTQNDMCTGTICAGTAYACDDGVACTEDRCDGDGGCTYPVGDGFCRIDGLCVAVGATNSDDPCRICQGGEVWSSNDGASCDDGDSCTKSDICSEALCLGETYVCDDGLWCTNQTCDGVGGCLIATPVANHCLIGDECVSNGESTQYGCARCVNGNVLGENEGGRCETGSTCRDMGRCLSGSCDERTACADENPCTIGYCSDGDQCIYSSTVEDLKVLSLVQGWSRVLSSSPVVREGTIWSTLRSSFALNLDRLQPASIGVPGLDFVTLGTKQGLVATFNSDGSLGWYRTLTASSEEMSEISHMNATTHLVLGGIASVNVDFNGLSQPPLRVTQGGPHFLASYGTTGTPSWVSRFAGSEQISSLVARPGNSAFLVAEIDQTSFVMNGNTAAISVPPVAGSRMLIGVDVDSNGKALSAKRLVRFDRAVSPEFRWLSHDSTGTNIVAAIDSVSTTLFLGVSPTVTLAGNPSDRVAIASFDSAGRVRWVREFVSSDGCRLIDWSVGGDGRVVVAVDAAGAGVTVRSTTEVLATSPRGTSLVFVLGEDVVLQGQLSLDEQVLSAAASNRAENNIVLLNTGLVAGRHSDGSSFEWSLPRVGGIAILRTNRVLQPTDIAEVHGDYTTDLVLRVRDDMYLWSQATTDGSPRIGSIDDPMQPIQTTPGRVIYRLTSGSCE